MSSEMKRETSYEQTLDHITTKKPVYFSPMVYQFHFSPKRNQTISATRYQLIDNNNIGQKCNSV